jgi:UPF0271 protein
MTDRQSHNDANHAQASPGWAIDLNADVGEDPAALHDGREAALMAALSSANIACTGHAGDADSMPRVIELAIQHNVAIGAHPSYPDRASFGRARLAMPSAALRASLEQQIAALIRCAERQGARVVHAKPHGALYHAASDDPGIAHAILEAARACDRSLALVGLAGSRALRWWRDAGATTIAEGFADRGYDATGGLLPRSATGAVIADAGVAAAQAVRIARDGEAIAVDGTRVPKRCQTLCVHSDTPGAPALAARVRAALESAGVTVAPAAQQR